MQQHKKLKKKRLEQADEILHKSYIKVLRFS